MSVFSQQRVINFGVLNQNTICSDGYIDDSGNSIVFMYNDASGFMIGSFDPYFNTNWITSFGVGSGTAGKLIKLSNGDFFGYILQDPSGHGHVFKFDSLGNIIWHKILDNTSNISECIELSNQNIAIIARYGVTPVYVVFNTNGVLQFSKTISDGHIGNQGFNDIIKTNDGQHLLIGGCSHSAHAQRIVLTKIDANFNQLWTKSFEYNGINNVLRNSVQDTSNDYFLVGGAADTSSLSFNDYDLSILKFDSIGSYSLGKSYGSQFRDIANDIEPGNPAKTGDSNLTIIGSSKPVEVCGDNLLVVSINSALDTVFTKHYGTSSGSGTSYVELHSTNDSLYTFGSYTLWSNISSSDGHLIKTNHTFDLECEFYKNGLEYSSDLQLTEITNPFVFGNASISLLNFNTISTSAIIVRDACNGMTLGKSENESIRIDLFPNPTNNTIYLLSELSFNNINVYDVFGKKVLELNDVNENHLKVDLSQLKKGSYIVEIRANSKVIRKKLILN